MFHSNAKLCYEEKRGRSLRTECIACGKHLFTINYNERICLNVKCEKYDKIYTIYEEDLDDGEYYYPDDYED